MLKGMLIKAWKEPEYSTSLSPEQWAGVPVHPSGELSELDEASLGQAIGGGAIMEYAPAPRLPTL